MNVIKFEIKLAVAAWIGTMFGLLIGFHVNQTLGIVIGFICIPIAGYAVISGQIKFFREFRKRRKKKN
jgi:hypothetical protein